VIRGGFNVYPREIEEVIYEHPDVREAAVIGVPHDTLGEEVGAVIVLKAGADATPEALREFVKQRVAAYKYPRHVWLVDELPKGRPARSSSARSRCLSRCMPELRRRQDGDHGDDPVPAEDREQLRARGVRPWRYRQEWP
jgi:acyl-CoA synthetase (AMP-forming)/AMP-acid ligase II